MNVKCPKCNEEMYPQEEETELINEEELCLHEYFYCPYCCITAIRQQYFTKHGEDVEYGE